VSGRVFLPYDKTLVSRARENRKNPTPAETLIWNKVLRHRQFQAYKFLRQKPIGRYIVDFYCAKLHLVIEIDGDSHARQVEYDEARSDYLRGLGLNVIRYGNQDVMRNIEGVFMDLQNQIGADEKIPFSSGGEGTNPPRSPLVRGEDRAPSPDKGSAGEGLTAVVEQAAGARLTAAANPPRSPLVRGEEKRGRLLSFVLRPLNSGFTLIELLLVIAILSTVAMAAFGLAVEDRGETRREDTLNRLTLLRRATLGLETPAYGGEMRLSGFVADNGRLPKSVRELAYNLETGDPDKLVEKAAQPPVYSKNEVELKNSACVQKSNDTNTIDEPAALLLKGYRGGGYLAGMTRNGIFRDGWGNIGAADDNDNFGWLVESKDTDNSLVFTSYGADNRPSGDDLEADQERAIVKEDWQVPLAGWQVHIRNALPVPDIPESCKSDPSDPVCTTTNEIPGADKLSIALLVFRNAKDGGEWLQFKSADNNCPDNLTPGDSCALTFKIESQCGGNHVPAEIPIGQHLALLLKDDEPHTYSSDPGSGKKIFAQATFYPGASRPVITLDIR
jgi:prepilin-type N-terminal cleavage/methylation domain-containing protein